MQAHRITLLCAPLLCAAACAETPPAPVGIHRVAPTAVDVAATGAIWASTVTDKTGPGSTYALYMPVDWNGDLVVYTHGYVEDKDPIQLPAIDGLRDALGANHFAVAYSSYSQNGFDVKDGAQRSHQLKGLFTSKFGKPARTYIMGHSLGGAIALMLAEQHPGDYDGALPMCGFLGGSTAEINFIANVRVLFDVFYPGVLPGNTMNVPAGTVLDGPTLGRIISAISANPTGAFVIAQTNQTAVPIGAHLENLGASVITALGFQLFGVQELLDRTHGHIMFDNSATVYSSANPSLAPALAYANAVAERYTATPDALEYLQKYYEPTGNITIPTITLHTTRDPVVPIWHESMYAAKAAAAGRSDNLVQKSVDAFGHCAFSGADQLGAFAQLVGWVEGGVRP